MNKQFNPYDLNDVSNMDKFIKNKKENNMNQFPEIRFDLDGIKVGIIQTLSKYNKETEEYVGAEIEKIIQSYDFDKVIRETAAVAIRSGIEKALEGYFTYGEGYKAIQDLVANKLSPRQ